MKKWDVKCACVIGSTIFSQPCGKLKQWGKKRRKRKIKTTTTNNNNLQKPNCYLLKCFFYFFQSERHTVLLPRHNLEINWQLLEAEATSLLGVTLCTKQGHLHLPRTVTHRQPTLRQTLEEEVSYSISERFSLNIRNW